MNTKIKQFKQQKRKSNRLCTLPPSAPAPHPPTSSSAAAAAAPYLSRSISPVEVSARELQVDLIDGNIMFTTHTSLPLVLLLLPAVCKVDCSSLSVAQTLANTLNSARAEQQANRQREKLFSTNFWLWLYWARLIVYLACNNIICTVHCVKLDHGTGHFHCLQHLNLVRRDSVVKWTLKLCLHTPVNKRNSRIMKIDYFLPPNLLHQYDTIVPTRPWGSLRLMWVPSYHVNPALPGLFFFFQLNTRLNERHAPAFQVWIFNLQWRL